MLLMVMSGFAITASAQFPGCPAINAGPDQTLPCSTPCTNLTATPFATGATTTYSVSSVPHNPPVAYNAGGGTAVSVGTDDVWSPIINLPFNFCFYGVNYTTVKVGSNGAIMFGPASGGGTHPWAYSASCNSSALTPAGEVFGVYHDIDPTVSGTVKWYLLGTAPCRIFVVSYNNLGHFSCTDLRSTHMMVLYETTNVIDVYVQQKQTCSTWNNGNAIIGIQNPTGSAGIAAPGRNAGTNWTVSTPEGWRFTPTGTPNYSVAWFQGATQIGTGNTINVCPTGTTTYTSKVTYNRCDGTQIVETDDVVLNFSGLTAPTVTPTAESCNGYNNGSVIINDPPGAGPYTVSISGPASASTTEANTAPATASFTGLPDGTYNYTVTGNNGCVYNGTFTIAAGPNCCAVSAVGTNLSCNGASNGTTTASPTGLAPFTYSWTGGQTSQTATGLPAGSYTVNLTDASGCTASSLVTITQPTALTGTLTGTNVSCNGNCDGAISVTASGGSAPYQYSLNGGSYQPGNSFSALCAGSYNVVVKDANNCTVSVGITITQPAVLNLISGTITQATCGLNNGSATVIASGGTTAYSYTIDGGSPQGSSTFTSLAPGSHTIVVTDAHGCTKNLTITVPAASSPVPTITATTNVSCFGGVNGSVVIGVTGGVSPFTYSIGGPTQPSNTFTNLTAGTYTATVQDANGCTGTVPFTIASPPQLTMTTSPTGTSCNGICDGQIAVTGAGGTSPYQYSSNSGTTYQAGNTLTGLCAGVTHVVIQDSHGCLANADVTITEPPVLTATFTHTDPLCHDVCNGQVVVTASGGTSAYQYSVNGGTLQSSNTFTAVCSGNNTMLVQDANGCQFTAVQTLANPPAWGMDTLTYTDANCGFNNGEFGVTANGANGPFTYSFNGGPFTSQNTWNNLFGGAYQIIATDAQGCTDTMFFGISDVEMDGIVLVQTDATCWEVSDGSIEVQNVSGAPPITYELDNSGSPQGSGFFGNLQDGSHVVTVYDGGNCVFVLPFMVGQPTEIEYQNTTVPVACSGGSTGQISFVSVSGGTPPYQYSIDGGTTYQASPDFTGLAATTYNVVVEDAHNCTVNATVTVTQAPPLAIASTVIDLNCNGDNSGGIQIGASGGTAPYQYSIDNGTTYSASTDFFGLAAGTYQLMIQDAMLCTLAGTATVNEPAVLTATYAVTDATCNALCNGEIVVTAAGGTAPYMYSADNGTTQQTGATITGLCAGNQQMLITDAHNCQATATQTVAEPAAITFTTAVTDETCAASNGVIAVTATGGTGGFTYSDDAGSTSQASNTFNGLPASIYSMLVTDANGCTATGTATVNNQASPVITGITVTDVDCNAACDGLINTVVSGGTGAISYSIGTPQASPDFTNVCAGSYTLTITDANGCTDSQPVTVNEPTALAATVTPTDLTCFGDNSGEIAFAASGGTTPYMYSTDNGATFNTGSTVQFLSAGTYNTIVEDAHNCVVNTTITVNEPALLAVSSSNSTDASCHGVCDGTADVNITGGTTPYTYSWSDGTSSTATSGLCAGSYSVDVTDAHGCTTSQSYTITEPPLLVITSSSVTDALCNGSCDGTISINSPLGVNYSIDNGATYQASPNFTALCANNYTITVQDAYGCTQTDALVVGQPAVLVQNLIPEDGQTICYDGYGTLSGSATGGTAPYYFVWNTGDTTQYLNVHLTSPATFTCTVYDQNGCASNAQTASVNVRAPYVPSVTTPVYACPGMAVSINGSGTDGLPAYTYIWLNADHDTLGTGSNFTYTPAGNETIYLSTYDMCFAFDTLPVQVNIYTVTPPEVTVSPAIGCSPLDATFNFSGTSGSNIAAATWDFGDGSTEPGTSNVHHQYIDVTCYDVSVDIVTTDGCATSGNYPSIVCVAPDPVADFSWNPTTPTNTNSTINFTDMSTGAVGYDWTFSTYGTSDDENPTVTFDDIEPGGYTFCLEVTSEYGCTNQICKTITIAQDILIFVPNTFTPDGDEFNNVFIPVMPPGMIVEDYALNIWDRWGEILFESHDPAIGWDGTYHDGIVKEGTYTWTLQVKVSGNSKPVKMNGHVNLLR